MEGENMKLSFRDVTEFLFLPLMTAAVFILWDLNKSVGVLNVQVGVLITNNSTLEKRVNKLENRIEKMEDRNSGNIATK